MTANHRKSLVRLVFLAVTAFVSTSVFAQGDPQRGAQLAGNCLGCHGIAGWRNAYPPYSVPKLGGQHPAFIASMLQAYKGKRYPHATMQAIASTLSEKDMQDLAAYWSAEAKIQAREGEGVGAASVREKAKVCAGCHGIDGNSTNPQFPRLAGQYADYLVKALKDYKSGARPNPIMRGFAGGLSERDMTELAAWFASHPGLTVLPPAQP